MKQAEQKKNKNELKKLTAKFSKLAKQLNELSTHEEAKKSY